MDELSTNGPPIDAQRLLRLIDELALFGSTERGGVDRAALSRADREARMFLVQYATEYGLAVERDPMANLFVTLRGSHDGAAVGTGSHIDSQPTGGRLDGAYGVCAGLEVLVSLAAAGCTPKRSLELAIWTNEEGSRFAPGAMGSAAFANPHRLDEFREALDAGGVSLGDELDGIDLDLSDVATRPLGGRYAAFVELHIEQGPILEGSSSQLGIVTGVQGCRWFTVETTGKAAHAGTTPPEVRHDAVRALLGILDEVRSWAGDRDLRVTIGRLGSDPDSVNTVPDSAHCTIDLRHPDIAVLDELQRRLERRIEAVSPCGAALSVDLDLRPTPFHKDVVEVIEVAAKRSGAPWTRLTSGAFHDAVNVAAATPTAMLFVPSKDGISHNPAEETANEDLVQGAYVLADALWQLSSLPG